MPPSQVRPSVSPCLAASTRAGVSAGKQRSSHLRSARKTIAPRPPDSLGQNLFWIIQPLVFSRVIHCRVADGWGRHFATVGPAKEESEKTKSPTRGARPLVVAPSDKIFLTGAGDVRAPLQVSSTNPRLSDPDRGGWCLTPGGSLRGPPCGGWGRVTFGPTVFGIFDRTGASPGVGPRTSPAPFRKIAPKGRHVGSSPSS